MELNHARLKESVAAIEAHREKNEKILNGTNGTRLGNAWA